MEGNCLETPENNASSPRGPSLSEPLDPIIEFPDCQPIVPERSPSIWFSSRHSKHSCLTITMLLVLVGVLGIVGMTLLSVTRNRQRQDKAQIPNPQMKEPEQPRIAVLPSVSSVSNITKKKKTTTKSPPQAQVNIRLSKLTDATQGMSSFSRLHINTVIKPSPTHSDIKTNNIEKLDTTSSAPSIEATEILMDFTATVNSVPAISATTIGNRTVVKTTLKQIASSPSSSSLLSSLSPLPNLSISKSRDSIVSKITSTSGTRQASTPSGFRSTHVVTSYVTKTLTERSVTPQVTTTSSLATEKVSISTTQRLQSSVHRHTAATTVKASPTSTVAVGSSSAVIRPSVTVGPTSTATPSPTYNSPICKGIKPEVIAAAALVPLVVVALGIVGYVLYRRLTRNKYDVLSHPLSSVVEQGSGTVDNDNDNDNVVGNDNDI